MMRPKALLILPALMMFACEQSTSPEPERMELTTSVDPDGSGSVNPEGGTYEAGTEVELFAVPAEEWEFVNWKGDITSVENPVLVTMNSPKHITAHFEMRSEAFNETMTITDGQNTTELIFGMNPDATDNYDENLDKFAPPPPPSGAFYAHFIISGENLLQDYRPVNSETTVWELGFAPEEGRTITLEWDAAATTHIGILILTDDPADPLFEIDMKSQSSYEVPNEGSENLFVISN